MWWIDVVVVVVLAFGVYGFVTLTRSRTAWFDSKSTRRAEDLYGDYADRCPPDAEHQRGADDRSNPQDPQQ